MQRGNKFIEGGKTRNFILLAKALDQHGKRGTVFEADMEALRAQRFKLRREYDAALLHADIAIKLYKNRRDNVQSKHQYLVEFDRAKILKSMEKPIPAVLQYQVLMLELKKILPADHIFVNRAFTGWMNLRTQLDQDGRLQEAEAAGLCECWPFNNYKDKLMPLVRIPPIMPPEANKSGHVNVIFDVDENGKPFNIKSIEASNTIFIKPSLKAVEQWQFSAVKNEDRDREYKGISTTIIFALKDENGGVIPE